ncbi:nuclear transport factor 2 family protein [Sphingobium sp.]|uniref:nuclear transport factor 2 family protein n=1 Tax=Sphingobium sp. TaxID=1912891 RepID=UPI002B91EAF4|nr:nuclear transport factor 2 family protein [Sphingobium sp.]HUD94076.1 nuclear transport factor 2 family protein [Sphingobium sp.]
MPSKSSLVAEQLIAHDQIGNALARHSRGVDRADAALIISAYHPGASVDYGFFIGEADALATVLADAMADAPPTLHRTAPPMIRLDGDRAVSEAYVIAYTQEPGMQRLIFGRYLDRLERREGAWRIVYRRYVMDGNVNRADASRPPAPSSAPDHFVPTGAKGSADPALALLAHHHASSLAAQGAAPMSPDTAALDQALSRLAIHDLVMTYCRGIDRGDAELLASIFWEDSTVVSGIVNASGPAFADGVTAYCTANLDYCFHSVANEWIDVKGDHGVGEHYVIAHLSAGGQDVMTGGRYLDRYERRNGVWKIASRTFVADWNTAHPASMALDGMYEPLKTRGAFGKDDPVHAHWASL